MILAGGLVTTLALGPAQAVICTNGGAGGSPVGDDSGVAANTACGQNADATGNIGGTANTAIGNGADAHGILTSSSSGAGAPPPASHNTAVGDNAHAFGDGSLNTADGAYSDAHGDGSDNSAQGSLSQASGNGSSNTASGDQANASGDDSANVASGSQANAFGGDSGNAAFGVNSDASGDFSHNVAIGAGAIASGTDTDNTAIGAGAVASGANSSAFGAGAIAAVDNQQMFGTPTNTYTMAGINSQASKDAQVGDTYFVTSDAQGNLATATFDFSPLGKQLDALSGQIKTVGALGAALAGLHPNSRATGDNQLSGAVGMYNGQIGAALGYFRNVGNNALVSVGAATSNGDTMTNAGVTLSW